MRIVEHPRNLQEIEAAARAVAPFSRSGFFALFNLFKNRNRAKFRASVARFIDHIATADPTTFSEEQFAIATGALSEVISTLESHLAENVEACDTAQCQFLGDSIRKLKEARGWIAQGLSPDPSRRPTRADLDRLAAESAASAFAAVFRDQTVPIYTPSNR